jgi:threonine dehydratase
VAFQGFNERKFAILQRGCRGGGTTVRNCDTKRLCCRSPGAEGRVWIKAESLQRGGAFKFAAPTIGWCRYRRPKSGGAASSPSRPATTRKAWRAPPVCSACRDDRDAGRCAQGETRQYRSSGRRDRALRSHRQSREVIAAEMASERGAVLVPSFDDVDVVEGQGTCRPRNRRAARPRAGRVVMPCGGGGLAAGHRAGAARQRDRMSPSPRAGTIWGAACRRARSSRCRPTRPPRPATRSRRSAWRISPSTR